MNITLDKYLKLLIIQCLLSAYSLNAQVENGKSNDADFKIGIEVGSGYGFKLRTSNKLDGEYSSSGMNYTLRVKWGSGNIFGAGFETGYITISSLESTNLITPVGLTNLTAKLNAIPLLFIVTTQYAGFQLNTGFGYYSVNATSTAFGSTIESSEWDFGYLLSLGYSQPINSTFMWGAEVKWNNISEVRITNLSLQLKLHILLYSF